MSPAEAEVLILLVESDPCVARVRLQALRLAGSQTGSVQEIEFRDRRVRYHPSSTADTNILDELIRKADAVCLALSGKSSSFAITLGGGPRRPPFGR